MEGVLRIMGLLLKDIWKFLTNRLFILFCGFVFLFFIMLFRLFELQIIRGEYYLNNVNRTMIRRISVEATRGTIYDRFGRPLAINETSFSLMMDPTIRVHNFNDLAYRLMLVLERFEEDIIDTLPISQQEPYVFMFNNSVARERRWKEDMTVPLDYTATEAVAFLRELFQVPEYLSNERARKVLNIRSAIFMERFRLEPIPLAIGVRQETIAYLEEQSDIFQGVYVHVGSTRFYPEGRYLSHIIGYTRLISEQELERLRPYGYTSSDIVGKIGIEQAFEQELRGTQGEMFIEVTNIGRRISHSMLTEPIPGDRIYLTIDARLQRETYRYIEGILTDILLGRINNAPSREEPVLISHVIAGLVRGNHISTREIMQSAEGTVSYGIREFLMNELPEKDYTNREYLNELREFLIGAINANTITIRDMLFVMVEQGVISYDDDLLHTIATGGTMALRQIVVDRIEQRELTPHMIGIAPYSGSAVITDVHTGAVLAAVSYPSYDNNQFVHNFNAYFTQQNNDPTTPLVHRAFDAPIAPGSTFKMITGLAALSQGVIHPWTTIHDGVIFTRAGWPYARCMSPTSHGSINVAEALAVSCNYFFFDVSLRLAQNRDDGVQNIDVLNEYMTAFGLGLPTGVEIIERSATTYDSVREMSISRLASPDFMRYLYRHRWGIMNQPWRDGDTIRTSIGQSLNSYTAAVMARYTSTLANGGTRHRMHMLNRIESYGGELIKKQLPEVELEMDIDPAHLQIIFQGMYDTTHGPRGTARNIFQGFPINVGGKTGTAEETGRRSHSSFAGFAPFENPQMAVYVVIPQGDNAILSAPAARVARGVMEIYFGFNYEPENRSPSNFLSR